MEKNFINKMTNILKGRSIFLIGMMACGKSKTAPKLAQRLKYKHIDLDLIIEKVAKKSISNIFLQDGEKIFRDYETQCLKEIIKLHSLVISTGGGVVTKNENWGILRQGIVVWIDLDKDSAIKRLKGEKNNRPLLKNKDLEKTYDDIWESRKDLYDQADLRISVIDENIDEVAEKIIVEMNKIISI
tara:strand:- start:1018 stop:1575 length:558 start_codon:yes stop_codon:yes gene_type:complete